VDERNADVEHHVLVGTRAEAKPHRLVAWLRGSRTWHRLNQAKEHH
jgi:hypothetical protein